jgi:hypothetical protein
MRPALKTKRRKRKKRGRRTTQTPPTSYTTGRPHARTTHREGRYRRKRGQVV